MAHGSLFTGIKGAPSLVRARFGPRAAANGYQRRHRRKLGRSALFVKSSSENETVIDGAGTRWAAYVAATLGRSL